MRKKKTMLLLGGALVALLCCYAGLTVWNDHQKKEAETEEEASKIYLVDAEELTAVSYTDGESTLGFVKEDGTWYDAEDREIPMNQDVVSGFADTVASLTAKRELKDPDDVADYGLDAPAYTISFTAKDGEDGAVYIGDMTGEDYYAMVKGSDKIYTISDNLPYSMDFDLYGYVQTDTVPSISSGNLKKVEITENGAVITYEDEDALGELAGGWGTLSLTELADYHVTEETLADYGLDEASRVIAAAEYEDTNTGDTDSFTVYLGSTDEDGNRYVMVEGSVLVYTISSSVADNMLTVEETADSAASQE